VVGVPEMDSFFQDVSIVKDNMHVSRGLEDVQYIFPLFFSRLDFARECGADQQSDAGATGGSGCE
jgi:hypothetical protein